MTVAETLMFGLKRIKNQESQLITYILDFEI